MWRRLPGAYRMLGGKLKSLAEGLSALLMRMKKGLQAYKLVSLFKYGAAGRIRTHDPLVRSQVLYPTELQPRKEVYYSIEVLRCASILCFFHHFVVDGAKLVLWRDIFSPLLGRCYTFVPKANGKSVRKA